MKKIISIFIVILLILNCAVFAAAQADTVSYSEEEKTMQRQNAATMLNELKEKAAEGVGYYKVPEGVYHFNNSVVGPFELYNAKNLVIDCQGSAFYSDKADSCLILLKDCENVTLKNFKADYDPLPYLQGVITDVDYSAKEITVTFDEDSPLPDDSWITNAGGMMKFIYFTPNGKEMVSSKSDFDSAFLEWVAAYDPSAPSIKRVNGRVYKLKLMRGYIFEEGSPVGVGNRFAIPWRRDRAVCLFGCKNVTLQDSEIYASPGYVINELYGDGGNRYDNVKIIRKPGTDRLLSGNADAFHSSCMVKGPVVENCEWEYTGDDFINIRGYYNIVTEVGNNWMKIASPYTFPNIGDCRTFRVGDDLEFYKYTDAEFTKLDSVTVTGIEDLSDTETIVLADLAAEFKENTGAQIRSGLITRLFKVYFNEPFNVDKYAVCFTRNCVGQGAVVKNNYFHDNLSRAVIIRGDNSVVCNNTFVRNGMTSILVYGSAYELEAGLPQNVTVTGNQIYYANYLGGTYDLVQCAAINANLIQGAVNDNVYLGEGIDITNNCIFDCNAYAILLNKYKDSSVYNNRVYNAQCKTAKYTKPFRISNSEALFADNLYNKAAADAEDVDKSDYAPLSVGDLKGCTKGLEVGIDDKKVKYDFWALGRGTGDFKCEVAVVDSDDNVVTSNSVENLSTLFGVSKLANTLALKDSEHLRIRIYNDGNVAEEHIFSRDNQ